MAKLDGFVSSFGKIQGIIQRWVCQPNSNLLQTRLKSCDAPLVLHTSCLQSNTSCQWPYEQIRAVLRSESFVPVLQQLPRYASMSERQSPSQRKNMKEAIFRVKWVWCCAAGYSWMQLAGFYLGACLGMGTGPLLSSLSTTTARLAHCRTPPGLEKDEQGFGLWEDNPTWIWNYLELFDWDSNWSCKDTRLRDHVAIVDCIGNLFGHTARYDTEYGTELDPPKWDSPPPLKTLSTFVVLWIAALYPYHPVFVFKADSLMRCAQQLVLHPNLKIWIILSSRATFCL